MKEAQIRLATGQTVTAEVDVQDQDGFVFVHPYATIEGRVVPLRPIGRSTFLDRIAYCERQPYDELAAALLDHLGLGQTEFHLHRASSFLEFQVMDQLDTHLGRLATRLWAVVCRDAEPDAGEVCERFPDVLTEVKGSQPPVDRERRARLWAFLGECLQILEDHPLTCARPFPSSEHERHKGGDDEAI